MVANSRRSHIAVGCGWILIVLSMVAGVRATEASAKAELNARTSLRAAVGARFVASYVDELFRRLQAQADALLGDDAVSEEKFHQAVRSLGFHAAVLLDGEGRVLRVHPDKPALVGADLTQQYEHLRLAAAGSREISVVVPSAVTGKPIVAFALPFETANGRRVFSGGFDPSTTPLAAFLRNATPITPNRAAIVDTRGGIVATNTLGESSARVAVSDRVLEAALSDAGPDVMRHKGTPFYVVDQPVEGTRWRMALAVPTDALYSPLRTGTLVVRGLAAVSSLAALIIGVLILRLAARSREAAVARDTALVATEHKSRFLAHMSHEIRNPMNGVIGTTEMLLETDLNPTQREYAEIARSSAAHLLEIVDDVLDFSKIEADRVELEIVDFSVRTLMQEVAGMFRVAAQRKSVSLTVNFSEDLHATVRGDPVRLRQVLTNLVGNAVKFTEKGSVELAAVKAAGDRVRFEVIDSGIGMTAEAASRVFEPFAQADSFTTRRYGGTGLGLTITKSLAELMGGTCGVVSAVSDGSTFWVEVPLPAVSDPTGVVCAQVAVAPGRGHLLLADDDRTNQRVAVAMLESAGFEVEVVGDGVAALVALEHGTFDAVLMDCHMPTMGGLEATVRLRAREAGGTRMPVIAMTGAASLGERDRCIEAGMDGFVAKPVNKRDLVEAVAQVITRA